MSEVVFDSNIVIDLLLGKSQATIELQRYSDVAISIVTWIEVLAGVSSDDEASVRETLSGYCLLPLTPEVAERAATIRRNRRIKLPDSVIQASAQEHGLTLVTRNERDFPEGMPGVRIPYRL